MLRIHVRTSNHRYLKISSNFTWKLTSMVRFCEMQIVQKFSEVAVLYLSKKQRGQNAPIARKPLHSQVVSSVIWNTTEDIINAKDHQMIWVCYKDKSFASPLETFIFRVITMDTLQQYQTSKSFEHDKHPNMLSNLVPWEAAHIIVPLTQK